jgi:ADP-ribose pyrophosphatase
MRRPPRPDDALRETTLARREVFAGRVLRLCVDTVRLPGGGVAEREVVGHPGAVAILPLLDGGRSAMLVRQYRHAVGDVLLEVPAGKLDRGEAPEAAAARELAEETGLTTDRLRPVGSGFASPGFSDEEIRLFVAEECRRGAAHPDADENLEAVEVEREDARRLLAEGGLRDLKTIALLALWLR